MYEAKAAKSDTLDVADLCRMFEESEESTYEARQLSERDRDYTDNIQLTAEEIATLEKRGQAPSIDNRIKTKVDYLVGFEKQQRIQPKALPRTPKHETDADGATQGLRYVSESEDYEQKRSGVWRNMLVEGAGGIRVSVEPSKYSQPMNQEAMMGSSAMTPPQEMDIKISRVAWDRMFADPHSSDLDYEDAAYKGLVIWMDYDDALAKYGDNEEAKDILDTTLSLAPTHTYDDKPKFSLWADKKRKRVRICQIWVKRDDTWYFAEYTKGGILKAGESPHKTDKGESDDELVFQAAYKDRDNRVYGLVREMIPLQDEINKRRSKSLHLLNVHQTTYEDGAVDDIETFRREKAKPDGTMKVNPGALSNQNGPRIISETRTDLAEGHFKLMQEAKNSIDLKGPNATEMGDKTGGSNAASGKAIIASQQGGMTQIGDLMDGLRHLDKRVFRKIWNRIRQYWTAEKWIRVTDDERNIKWLGMNVDPAQVQMLAQQNPQAAQKIAGVVGNVAELDCDIILDASPDGITPQLEQFQMLVELKKFDANNELPFRAIMRAAPNLKDKDKFLDEMDRAQEANGQQAKEAAAIQKAGAIAQVKEVESKAMLNMAKAQAEGMPDQAAPMQPQEEELPMEVQIAQAVAEIVERHAKAKQADAAAYKTTVEAELAPQKAAQDAELARANFRHQTEMDRANFQQGAQDSAEDRKIKAKQASRKPAAA
jgi:hypothetical protein